MSTEEGERQPLTGAQRADTGSTRPTVAETLPPARPPKGLPRDLALYDTRFVPYDTAVEMSKNANEPNTAELYLKGR